MKILMLMLRDGLRTASGVLAPADYHCLIYCRVPDTWVTGEIPASTGMWLKGPTLQDDKLEQLFRQLYGANWRNGNEDGSEYIVSSIGTRLLNPAETAKPWETDDPDNKLFRYFYFITDAADQFKKVSRGDFST